MDIITSHGALDFDGLASMVAAEKLYPQAVKVFSGPLSPNVKRFMSLYKDLLIFSQVEQIDPASLKQVIVVDTANPARLGKLREIALRPDLVLHIYDHHPPMEDDLQGEVHEVHLIGAATTILVEEIIRRSIDLSPFDATILALGIYEDTGSLLFTSTTARDLQAAAYLVDRGANLSVVAQFIDQPLSRSQRRLMQELLTSTMRHRIRDYDVVIASCRSDEFVSLVAVAHRLLSIENCDAVFVLAVQENKLNVIARSGTANIPVNRIIAPLKGRGHDMAASAIVKDKTIEEVAALIVKELNDKITSAQLARDIMSTPVKTVPLQVSMEDAGKIMLRYGHTGMPVVDGERMVGVISRRDVDKARQHNLGHAPVKGFMTQQVVTATPDTPVSELQKVMITYDIGRIPVVDSQGNILGIVSRTDVLRTLHGNDYPEDHSILYTSTASGDISCVSLMQSKLPGQIFAILKLAGQLAAASGFRVYLVGGFVRDLLLNVPNFDVDLVVEGDGPVFARQLAEMVQGRVRIHQRFKTAVVVMADGFKIDIATARAEYYEFPAALPQVQRSSIREDLYRRDFTMNTLAIALYPDHFGELIDFFGGRRDIEQGLIRILYNLSFVEDPTRVIRAIRFEQRYQFTIEPDTLRFARDAIERRMLGQLSYGRILNELILILSERDPIPALRRMKEIGVWEYIFPEIDLERLDWNDMRRIAILMGWWQERYQITGVKNWVVYLLFFLSALPREEALQAVVRYPLSKQVQRSIEESFQAPALAAMVRRDPGIPPSVIDRHLTHWTWEGIIYLLLCIKDEAAWEKVITYLDRKDQVTVSIDGKTLLEMGAKPGPVFSAIFGEIYKMRLDGVVKNRQEEIDLVNQWLEEDKFSDGYYESNNRDAD